jgi:hypothetical protein
MSTHPESVPRYPLAWPLGWPRAPHGVRVRSAFKSYRQYVSMPVATQRLEAELDRLAAERSTLSTNVELRLDGRPRADSEPKDPGAAVYFTFRGRATVLACDKYDRVADNIVAIANHIDALRRIERYGVGTIEQALAGYRALPADSAAAWRQVFGFADSARVSLQELDARYKSLARERHPDRGGSEEGMAHLNRARTFAHEALRNE